MAWQFPHTPAAYPVSFDFAKPAVAPIGDALEESVVPSVLTINAPVARSAPLSAPEDPTHGEAGMEEDRVALAEDQQAAFLGCGNDGAGGGGEHPEPPITSPAPTDKKVGCAMSGPMLAIATLEAHDSTWRFSAAHSRLFYLADRSQHGLRKFGSELYQFLRPLMGSSVFVCRTRTGAVPEGLEDECRIETLLNMLPGMEVGAVDPDIVAKWVMCAIPPYPDGIPGGRQTFAQIRAIEVAQYAAENMC